VNPHHRLHHLARTWLLTVVAVLALAGSMIQPVSAQGQHSSAADQFFSAVNLGTSMDLLSAGTVLHTPLGNFVGADGPEEFGRELREWFSDVEFTTNSIESLEHLEIVRFTMTAVHTGGWHGLAGNCVGITVPGVAVLRHETTLVSTGNSDSGALGQYLDPIVEARSRIVEQWISYDEGAIASQISAYNTIPSYALPSCFDAESSEPVASDPSALPPTTDEPAQDGHPY